MVPRCARRTIMPPTGRVAEPLVSMYGKEMRSGGTQVFPLSWDEIYRVLLSVEEFPPDGKRWVLLALNHMRH